LGFLGCLGSLAFLGSFAFLAFFGALGLGGGFGFWIDVPVTGSGEAIETPGEKLKTTIAARKRRIFFITPDFES
jgi:hypothetical protein